MASLHIYLRQGRIFVVMTDGLIDLEPVEIVTTVNGLTETLGRMLPAPNIYPDVNPDLRAYKWPVRVASRVRGWREFERGLKMLALDHDDGQFVARKYLPDFAADRGFNADGELFRLSDRTEVSTVATHVMEALTDSEWETR